METARELELEVEPEDRRELLQSHDFMGEKFLLMAEQSKWFFFCFFFFLYFLGPRLQHMEVPSLGVELEL